MPEPCKQEAAMKAMDARWASVGQKLDRFGDALEALAVQKVEIEHLAEQGNDSRKWLKDHENRIQSLERAPGAAAGRFLWVLVGGGVAVATAVSASLMLLWIKGSP